MTKLSLDALYQNLELFLFFGMCSYAQKGSFVIWAVFFLNHCITFAIKKLLLNAGIDKFFGERKFFLLQ